ncbi:MAG TPA: phenylalanine--tRNA ligase subunit alpha [Oscillatoriaceae cyanobacterium]
MNQVAMEQVLKDAEAQLSQAGTLAALEEWYLRYFSREHGEINALLRQIPQLPPAERGTVGKAINQGKQALEAAYNARKSALSSAALDERLKQERLDVSLPARNLMPGHVHPVSAVKQELIDLFAYYGFQLAEGPEIEDDWHNFTALNTPADHPARDMQDTFYLPGGHLLRTQTSSVQIRAMERREPPLRLIMPGRVYRRDEITKRHYPIFHQLEGLMIEEGTTFGHLKGLLIAFCQELFGRDRKVRFRPSYFPFTEPSTEVDVECPFCKSKGCGTCSYSGWIELLGAGMVHPNVLEAVNYNPEKVTGLAFGLGIERVAMIRYGINDIRHFWENDYRFLSQF